MGGVKCTHTHCKQRPGFASGLWGSGFCYSVNLGKFFTLSVPVSHLQNRHCNTTTFQVIRHSKTVYLKYSAQWLAHSIHSNCQLLATV